MMAIHPTQPLHQGSSTWNHAYLMAGVRAGLIALVLLAGLVLIAVL